MKHIPSLRRLTTVRRSSSRRVAAAAALFTAIICCAIPAKADTYYYRDKSGPVIENLGNGEFQMKYLTYDYAGLDDYIDYMYVYVVQDDNWVRLFQHRGNHENNGGDYNCGYGRIYNVAEGVTLQSVSCENAGDLRYRTVKVTLPQCYWGAYRIFVAGRFCYERNDPYPLLYSYYLPTYDMGSPRFSNAPSIKSVTYEDDNKVRFHLEDVPRVRFATSTLTFYMDGTEIGSLVANDGSAQGATAVDHTFALDSFDGSYSHTFKVESKVAFNGRTSAGTVSLNRDAFAAATNLNGEFCTVKRAVTLTWELDNDEDDAVAGISVQRRPYGAAAWTEIGRAGAGATQMVDDDCSALLVGRRYEYRVVPFPALSASELPAFAWNNIKKYDITLKPALDIDISATRQPGGATVEWQIPHSTEFDGCKIAVWRSTASGSGKTKLADVDYADNGRGSYTDSGISGVYKYYLVLDASSTWYGRQFSSSSVQVQTIESATVREMRVSKGEYAGLVHMEWDVTNVTPASGSTPERTTFTLWRRSLESDESEFSRIHTLSTNDEYIIYEDKNVLPGIYYEYRLDALAKANDEEGTEVLTSTTGVGFSMSSGKITGTISYGSGTAVAGVDVVATPSGGVSDMTSSRCLDFSGHGEARIACSADKLNSLFNNAKGFSLQMWLNPTGASSVSSSSYLLANIGNSWGLYLRPEADGSFTLCHALMQDGAPTENADILAGIPAETYSHLTLCCRDGVFTAYLHAPDGAGTMQQRSGSVAVNVAGSAQATAQADFCLGGSYKGQLDDFRLWNCALTSQEVADNYNRSLTGAESGLEIYWRFDEGLDDMFFDSSRKGTILNGNHGTLTAGVVSSTLVPSSKYLAYRAVTDTDGNYMIDGIPFAGEGTSYSIVPAMGIHEFKPNKLLRYVGANSLVHNATDFTDVSSFPVSGKVYYENTTYPVADCNFYIDGVIASREGKMIASAEDGSFTIDVPIGDHHIEVRKEGHSFLASGRYPADPDNVGTKLTFDREITGLTFEDATLVNFAGRVTGGAIEGDKPIGFAQSVNTIGKARISLVPQDDRHRLNVLKQVAGSSVEYVTNPATLPCDKLNGPLGPVESSAWRGAGDEDRTRIFIDTDPATGEFSAMLPPLRYLVESVRVLKTGTVVAEGSALDLSNPIVVLADSLKVDGVMHRYEFNKGVKFTHRTPPTLQVADRNAEPGAFGIMEYDTSDEYGPLHVADIYTVGENGEVGYTYAHPVYISGDPYIFDIRGFEEYVNADREDIEPVSYKVPLKDVEVTISNDLSAIQEVYNEGEEAGKVADSAKNSLKLDADGAAVYKWRGGLPNINDPFTRNINISYTVSGKTYTWNNGDLECLLFGQLPTGANFITAGPDHVDMVLRDPPGSASKAEWTKGSINTTIRFQGAKQTSELENSTIVRFGPNNKVATGVGMLKIEEIDAKADAITGCKFVQEHLDASTSNRTVTATRTISTSDAREFVGSMGDIYVGSSTNITFGNAREVNFHRENADAAPAVSRRDVMTTGLSFGTNFTYTQFFVENILLPNFEKLIESKLTYADQGTIDSYVHSGDGVAYLTPLKKGDKGFGSANDDKAVWGDLAKENNTMDGPSYWMFAPNDDQVHTDSIAWLNRQIVNWKKIMAQNEKDKVQAYHLDKGKYFIQNLSFDGGATVTYSEQNDSSATKETTKVFEGYAIGGGKSGITWNKVGTSIEITTHVGGGSTSTESQETGSTATFSYTLAENDWDAITLDVMKSPNKWSPIFHTRAGQTSAPYEGEERTKYFDPGQYTLHEATMQMEVPRIAVENPVAVDVPIGGSANYRLKLSNESEVDYDFYFLLLVPDESNPDGAAIKLDGQPLTNGRRIKVPAGEIVSKTLQLSQTQPGVLDYNDIRLVLASEVQNDPTSTMAVIADTCSISAHFVPSSSEVALKVPSRVVNTATGTTLAMSFDGFDRSYAGLKAFRLQYRLQGAPAWTREREYVLREDLLDGNNQLLPEGGSVAMDVDMRDWPDGTYLLRMLSVSEYGSEEVSRSSDEVEIVKDTARPAPIGVPTPSNGILGVGDELSVTFNEDLLSGYITAADNITVRGRLNDAPVSHDGVFHSSGGDGAVTNAAIDLGNGSFSLGFWLKWSAEGSLLRHGTANNSLDISVDAEGHAVVTVGGGTFTSATAIPRDKWSYVNVAYNKDAGTLTADVAYDAVSLNLLDNAEVGDYTGNGVLTVGKGLDGSIHELTLWNRVRDFATAKSEIHTLKAPTTEGLTGYWRLDEGHGSEGADLARSRHMKLPDGNSWSLENKNIGALLDGSSFVEIDVAGANTASGQDYLIEMWCRGARPADGSESAVMSLDNGALALLASDGAMKLRTASGEYPVSPAQCLDGSWHHVALNVLRGSSGTGTLYLDGKAVAQYPAEYFPAIEAARLLLGAVPGEDGAREAMLDGAFDEVRLWHATKGAEAIRSGMYSKVAAGEQGLAAYYPFESRTLDAYGQTVTSPDLADQSGAAAAAVARVLKPGESHTSQVADWSTYSVPAIKSAPEMQNLRFSFTASDRKILIDLEEDEARVEGCSVEVNVHSVQDAHGNFSQPVVWTSYVSRNCLTWEDASKDVAMEVAGSASFAVNIVNSGSATRQWTLSGLPLWLEADRESGSITPLTSRAVTFSVAPGTAVGRYECTVALCGDDGLRSNLAVTLSVRAKRPDWSVNPAQYEYSMNVVGQLKVDGVYSEDADDMVAAFIGGECRGVASPAYFKRYDAYYLMLNVYGDGEDAGRDIEFKAFDASSGIVLPEVNASQAVVFVQDQVTGSIAAPVVLDAVDSREQVQALSKGWNWISLYVDPFDASPANVLGAAASDGNLVKSKSLSAIYGGGDWAGDLEKMLPGEMFKVLTDADVTLQVRGNAVHNAEHQIPVSYGWNWIGYDNNFYLGLDEAFAGLAPEDGDMVKGRDAFAIYMGYEWVGSLSVLTPGCGYIYKSESEADKWLTYPAVPSASNALRAPALLTYDEELTYTPCDIHKYQGNMTMVAQVLGADDQPIPCEVAVFDASGECRAANISRGDSELVYLTIQGEGYGESLKFRIVYTDGEGKSVDVPAKQTLTYSNDAVVGSLSEPFLLTPDEATGLEGVGVDGAEGEDIWFDMLGRRIKNPTPGVYIHIDPSGSRDVRLRK